MKASGQWLRGTPAHFFLVLTFFFWVVVGGGDEGEMSAGFFLFIFLFWGGVENIQIYKPICLNIVGGLHVWPAPLGNLCSNYLRGWG